MRTTRSKNGLTLAFNSLESQILQQILRRIAANYQANPRDLDPKAAAAWYSTRGCESAKMSAEETREWLEDLRQYKSANVEHLTRWLRRLALMKAGECRLNLKVEEASVLLTALNDHRLLLAAQHDVGQNEMDARMLDALDRLAPVQQRAISEIHFLACIIEAILRFMPGAPGDWMVE
jgi:hypothetical protein